MRFVRACRYCPAVQLGSIGVQTGELKLQTANVEDVNPETGIVSQLTNQRLRIDVEGLENQSHESVIPKNVDPETGEIEQENQ